MPQADGEESRNGPPGLKLGELPLARRDVERLRQILGLQRRLREVRREPARQARAHPPEHLPRGAGLAGDARRLSGNRRALEARCSPRALANPPTRPQPPQRPRPKTVRRAEGGVAGGGDAAATTRHSSRWALVPGPWCWVPGPGFVHVGDSRRPLGCGLGTLDLDLERTRHQVRRTRDSRGLRRLLRRSSCTVRRGRVAVSSLITARRDRFRSCAS